MKKLNLTLVCAFVSLLSYGQVIQNENENENENVEEQSSVMEAIRPPVDGTYEKIHIPHYTPVALPHLREADAYWTNLIWRVIDLREKFNFPLYYPTDPKGNWKSFMQTILDATNTDESNPNPLRIYSDEYVSIPVSAAELKKSMGENQTIINYDPETFEEIGQQEIFIPWGSKEVYRYELKEQWRIDKQRSVMDQVIIAICPMFWYEKLDGSTGDDYGSDNMDFGSDDDDEDDMPAMPNRRWRKFGWIYYPEIRPIMAVTEVFNPGNNAQRRNYDDLFLQRRFASFIKAEENVYDNREINHYLVNGLDQALEADKIKERLRTREHDIWEY